MLLQTNEDVLAAFKKVDFEPVLKNMRRLKDQLAIETATDEILFCAKLARNFKKVRKNNNEMLFCRQ